MKCKHMFGSHLFAQLWDGITCINFKARLILTLVIIISFYGFKSWNRFNFTVESIYQKHFKVLGMDNAETTESSSKKCLVLWNMLRISIYMSRVFGNFPFVYHFTSDGLILEFRWVSWSMLYWLVIVLTLAYRMAYYVPFLMGFMLSTSSSWKGGSLDLFGKLAVIITHICGCILILTVFVPLKASSIARVWNELQSIVSFFDQPDRRPQIYKKVMKRCYIFCQIWACIWITAGGFVTVFGSLYFVQYAEDHFLDKTQNVDFVGWFWVGGLPPATLHVVSHILNSILFLSLVTIMDSCFVLLNDAVLNSRPCTFDTFLKLFNIFRRLEKLCVMLSDSYGLIMIWEIALIALTSVANIYFGIYVLQGQDAGYHPVLPFFVVPATTIWLYAVSNVTEQLHKHVRVTYLIQILPNFKIINYSYLSINSKSSQNYSRFIFVITGFSSNGNTSNVIDRKC